MDLLEIDIALARREFELRAALSVGAETLALVGPSGAGKTSLLRTLAGLERPRAGRIVLGSEVWFDAGQRVFVAPEQRRVGYLPQDFGLFPHLDVAGNVRFAAQRPRPDLLDQLGIAHLAKARPHELSGGERQRVALARALARGPRVLLLDEPFAALDTVTRSEVREQLASTLASLALPTIVVTHSFRDAARLAARIGVLDRGRLVALATVAELIERPADATAAALTGANVLTGSASQTPSGSRIELAGGGELLSSDHADGPVTIAVAPWEIELCDADTAWLVDTVRAVTPDEGRLIVRLERFTVHTHPGGVAAQLVEGQPVGLRAQAGAVLVVGRREP